MNETDPTALNPAIKEALDGALRPMFGDNLAAFYAEQERHDADSRELIDRHRRCTQDLVDRALDRLTFFGGDRRAFLGVALEQTMAQREGADRELHDLLVAEKAKHRRRVEALRIDLDDEEPPAVAEGE